MRWLALILIGLTVNCFGQFPPPVVRNYWSTNLVPTDGTLLTNVYTARGLSNGATVTNIVHDLRGGNERFLSAAAINETLGYFWSSSYLSLSNSGNSGFRLDFNNGLQGVATPNTINFSFDAQTGNGALVGDLTTAGKVKIGGYVISTNSIQMPTNTGPTSVTVGTTAPDRWFSFLDLDGHRWWTPAWTNH